MYSKVAETSIYYQVLGEGEDLVLLHGFNMDVSSWWGTAELLKGDFKVWMLDLPGFGRSDKPKGWMVEDYAVAVKGFLEVNKIKKPILLGHSLGGNILIKLLALEPKIADRLILESSSGIRPKKSWKQLPLLIISKLFKYLVPEIFGFKEIFRNKFYKSIGSDYLIAGELKETFQNIVSEDVSEDAKKIETETLIIWGENDNQVSTKLAKKMYRLIKNSRLEILEGVGHFPHLEKPDLFTYYVKDFSNN